MGRPSSFTQEIADRICERIAEGEGLRRIVLDEGMPSEKTVYRWLRENGDFRQQYACAREDQAEHFLDEIMDIADDASRDTVATDSGEVANTEWIQRARLRVDARKWAMSKLAPKKYGDKIGIEHSGQIELASALEAARKRLKGDE
jgi:hypothetical protein